MSSLRKIRYLIANFGQVVGEHDGHALYSFVNRPNSPDRTDQIRIDRCVGRCPICGSGATDEQVLDGISIPNEYVIQQRRWDIYSCGMCATISAGLWLSGAADPVACTSRWLDELDNPDDLI